MTQSFIRPFDLELKASPAGDALELRVLNSPAGRMEASVTGPAPWVDNDLLSLLDDARKTDMRSDQLIKLGIRLHETLTPTPDVAARLSASIEEVTSADRPLRLRLFLETRQVFSIPWELTYDREKENFLAIDPRLRIIRLVSTPNPPDLNPQRRLPDVVIALSEWAQGKSSPEVENARELEDALNRDSAETGARCLAQPASLPALIDALKGRANVLQLYAHAAYAGNRPYLRLPDASGSPAMVDAETLAGVLRASSVPFTILALGTSAAQSPAADEDGALLDFAAGLVLAGAPAVLAMPTLMPAATATAFWAEFYGALADGGQSIDEALKAARLLLWQRQEPAAYWYRPALFTVDNEQALSPFSGRPIIKGLPEQRSLKSLR